MEDTALVNFKVVPTCTLMYLRAFISVCALTLTCVLPFCVLSCVLSHICAHALSYLWSSRQEAWTPTFAQPTPSAFSTRCGTDGRGIFKQVLGDDKPLDL